VGPWPCPGAHGRRVVAVLVEDEAAPGGEYLFGPHQGWSLTGLAETPCVMVEMSMALWSASASRATSRRSQTHLPSSGGVERRFGLAASAPRSANATNSFVFFCDFAKPLRRWIRIVQGEGWGDPLRGTESPGLRSGQVSLRVQTASRNFDTTSPMTHP